MTPTIKPDLETNVKSARHALDAWVREIVSWHFDPATGCPFWLDYAKRLDWDPRREIRGYDDLDWRFDALTAPSLMEMKGNWIGSLPAPGRCGCIEARRR